MTVKEFGKLVKIERIKKDITQAELSVKSGVSQTVICFIEQGLRVRESSLFKVAKFLELDIPLEEIMSLKD